MTASAVKKCHKSPGKKTTLDRVERARMLQRRKQINESERGVDWGTEGSEGREFLRLGMKVEKWEPFSRETDNDKAA